MAETETVWDRDYAGPGTQTIWDRDYAGPGTRTVWDRRTAEFWAKFATVVRASGHTAAVLASRLRARIRR